MKFRTGVTEVMFAVARSSVTVTSRSWIVGVQKMAADSTGLYAKNQKTTGRNSLGVSPLNGQSDGKTSSEKMNFRLP